MLVLYLEIGKPASANYENQALSLRTIQTATEAYINSTGHFNMEVSMPTIQANGEVLHFRTAVSCVATVSAMHLCPFQLVPGSIPVA